jgi:hypothetical protein
MKVESQSAESLGKVDGMIIDVASARPLYVAVDAGGWLTSKLFLVPIGHITLDSQGDRMVADVTREQVKRFPGFDRKTFETLSDDELRRVDEQIMAACCPDELTTRPTMANRYAEWSHYRQPDWWDARYYSVEESETGARSAAAARGASAAQAPTEEVKHTRETIHDREQVVARDREQAVARGGDVSPHAGGRAQPGDVVGIETGGERTHVGETSNDENRRRRDAEREAGKQNH